MQLGALPPAAAAAATATATPAAAAAAAGAAAAAASLTAGPRVGGDAFQMAARLVQEGGVRALYAGVGAATLRLVPMAVVSFGVYEIMRAVLLQAESQWDRHVAELQLQQLRSRPPPLVLSGGVDEDQGRGWWDKSSSSSTARRQQQPIGGCSSGCNSNSSSSSSSSSSSQSSFLDNGSSSTTCDSASVKPKR